MLGLTDKDYEDCYQMIKMDMISDDVSVDMKKALLSFEIGLRRVQAQELTEKIAEIDKKSYRDGVEDEDHRSD
jgi:hypothetical protein